MILVQYKYHATPSLTCIRLNTYADRKSNKPQSPLWTFKYTNGDQIFKLQRSDSNLGPLSKPIFDTVTPRLEGLLTTCQPAEYIQPLRISMPQNECLSTRDSYISKNGHVGPIRPYSPKCNQLYYNSFQELNYTLIQACFTKTYIIKVTCQLSSQKRSLVSVVFLNTPCT